VIEVAAINTGAADRFTLFAPASVPLSPSGPPRIGIVVVSLMLAIFLALSAVIAAEVLDTSVRGSRDVRSLMGRTPLAVVPRIQNSLYFQQRSRKLALLVGSLVLGAPVLYLVIRLVAA
jgi:polysaccharide biosynthesis transport protein